MSTRLEHPAKPAWTAEDHYEGIPCGQNCPCKLACARAPLMVPALLFLTPLQGCRAKARAPFGFCYVCVYNNIKDQREKQCREVPKDGPPS